MIVSHGKPPSVQAEAEAEAEGVWGRIIRLVDLEISKARLGEKGDSYSRGRLPLRGGGGLVGR